MKIFISLTFLSTALTQKQDTHFLQEITRSQLLSRKLAYFCCKKITYLVNDTDAMYNADVNGGGGGSGHTDANSGGGHATLMAAFYELMNDPYTRFLIFGLSAIVQHVTMECPAALVWHHYGDNKSPPSLIGKAFLECHTTSYNVLLKIVT